MAEAIPSPGDLFQTTSESDTMRERKDDTTKLRAVSADLRPRKPPRHRTDDPDADSGEDAPVSRQAREDSAQVLLDGLKSVDKGSAAEKALLAAYHLLLAQQHGRAQASAGSGGHWPPMSPASIKRWATAIVASLAIVAPVVQQGFGAALEFFRPNAAVIDRLDSLSQQISGLESEIEEARDVTTSIVTWSVDCQRAQANGGQCPAVPPILNLVAAQAAAAKDR